jgi:NAD(P)-dependent dehydrogenase (short-subunit alcohol dehydrogenase family)
MQMNYTESDVPDQTGKVFFVTGANTGVGFETARILAQKNGRVLLGCRSQDKATEALNQIRTLKPEANITWVPLDLASLRSIAHAADIVRSESRLDGLINNAGVMMPPRTETEDGFELQFGVNHLGHFALTGHLLPLLMHTPGARIVTVSSLAHRRGEIDYGDIDALETYDRMARYQMSKFANMLFMLQLQRRLTLIGSSVLSVACHPGVAATELGRHTGLATIFRWLRPLFNSPLEGAQPTLMAATDKNVQGGDYFGPKGIFELRHSACRVDLIERARNQGDAAQLWEISEEMTRVRYDFHSSIA